MTLPSRPALVVNPTKVRNMPALRTAITDVLGRADIAEPIWLETTADDPGTGQTRAAVSQGADLVMAFGGDGTLRACAASLTGSQVPLALLPAGTGNLLARNLGIPARLQPALEVALRGQSRQIDVCHAGSDSFVVMAGMGFDARLLAGTSSRLKQRIGWLAYGLAAIQATGGQHALRIHIDINGGRSITMSGVGVLVANVGTLTGGMTLLPHAHEDDGMLTVGILTAERLQDWAALALRLVTGQPPGNEQLAYWQTRSLRVVVDPASPVEVDGEVLGDRVEQEFRVSPRALAVRVPATGGN